MIDTKALVNVSQNNTIRLCKTSSLLFGWTCSFGQTVEFVWSKPYEVMNLACKQDVVRASGFFVMVWCVILELKRSPKETLSHLDRCDIQLSCYRPFSTVYAFYHILHMWMTQLNPGKTLLTSRYSTSICTLQFQIPLSIYKIYCRILNSL